VSRRIVAEVICEGISCVPPTRGACSKRVALQSAAGHLALSVLTTNG
jgi:hypothetical protein